MANQNIWNMVLIILAVIGAIVVVSVLGMWLTHTGMMGGGMMDGGGMMGGGWLIWLLIIIAVIIAAVLLIRRKPQ
jgi:hypothetical protein